jgi:hypothetical protein
MMSIQQSTLADEAETLDILESIISYEIFLAEKKTQLTIEPSVIEDLLM